MQLARERVPLLKRVADLVRIPSHTPEGELEIMRYTRDELQKVVEWEQASNIPESQRLRLREIPIEGDIHNRFTLLAERGTENAPWYTLNNAHEDTVEYISEGKDVDDWPDRYEWKNDSDEENVLGGYDMKAGVGVLMSIAENVLPPEGTAHGIAFQPDEERNSAGAKALIKWWLNSYKRPIKALLSNEVEPRTSNDVDERQSIVVGRYGVLKVHGKFWLEKGSHGSLRNAPNALDESDEFMHFLRNKYFPKHALKDPYHFLGPEWICSAYRVADARHEQSPPKVARFGYKVFLLPPEKEKTEDNRKPSEDALVTALKVHEEALKLHRVMRRWEQRGIRGYVRMDRERLSYPPFATDPSHPLVQIAAEEASAVCHPGTPANIRAATSNADTNLYAEMLQKLAVLLGQKEGEEGVAYDIPVPGKDAHSRDEKVFVPGIRHNYEIFRRLLEQRFPALVRD